MQALRVSPRLKRHSQVSTTSPGPLNSFATKSIPHHSRRATSTVSHLCPTTRLSGMNVTRASNWFAAITVAFDVMLVQRPHEVGFFSRVIGRSALTRPTTLSVTLSQIKRDTTSWFQQEAQHFTFGRSNIDSSKFSILNVST